MAVLCCTAKYRKALGLPNALPQPAPTDSALGDWYGNTLNIGRGRFLHYMAEKPRLSVIVPLRDRHRAEQSLARTLFDLLIHFGVGESFARREVETLDRIAYARASDRSVLGSMTDQAFLASFELGRRPSLWEVNLDLSDTPCSPLGYRSPSDVAPELIAVQWGLTRS